MQTLEWHTALPAWSCTRASLSYLTSKTVSLSKTSAPCSSAPPEGNGVVIAVIIVCILLLAILGSVLYFLYKKGKICGRSGKQDLWVPQAGWFSPFSRHPFVY